LLKRQASYQVSENGRLTGSISGHGGLRWFSLGLI
jgi:hypothetical protein